MKSEFFYCPHCSRKLAKSAAATVFGEIGGLASSLGTSHVTCPSCGNGIDAQAMIDGKYDYAGGAEGVIFLIAWVAGVAVLQAAEYEMWSAAGFGFLIGVAAVTVWVGVTSLFRKLFG